MAGYGYQPGDAKTYYGTKKILAWPNYNPQCGEDEYHVQYEDGYQSKSPKEAFEKAYRDIFHLNFGLVWYAVMVDGQKARRKGWDPDKLYIKSETYLNDRALFLFLGYAQHPILWVPNNPADITGSDWEIINP